MKEVDDLDTFVQSLLDQTKTGQSITREVIEHAKNLVVSKRQKRVQAKANAIAAGDAVK